MYFTDRSKETISFMSHACLFQTQARALLDVATLHNPSIQTTYFSSFRMGTIGLPSHVPNHSAIAHIQKLPKYPQ